MGYALDGSDSANGGDGLMINYGEDPSNQMELELPGLTTADMELMRDARKWVMNHRFIEWEWYLDTARRESFDGKASPNYVLQAMHRKFRLEIPNAYAPALTRIAMEQDARIHFRLAKSKVDSFTKAKL